MPTGGVDCTEESLTKWFKAGVVCVGIGSNLITKELLEAKDYAGIAEKVRDDDRADPQDPGEVSDGRGYPEDPSRRRRRSGTAPRSAR